MADGAAFYSTLLRSIRATDFNEERCVELRKQFLKKENNNHIKGKRPARKAEVW